MAFFNKFIERESEREEAIESIVRNLNYMLNTHKTFGSWHDRFGLGDYNEFRGRDEVIKMVLSEITENIERFEPRVNLSYIKRLESDSLSRLRFELKCAILNFPKPLYLIFDSISNKVLVEEYEGEAP